MRRSEYLKSSPPMFESRLLDRFTRVHPVVPVVIYAPLVVVMLWLGIARDGLADAIVLALVGYLIYDEMHYALHHHMPKSRLGKRLRELHMRHHFQDDERGFGISAPYWDTIFRTFPSKARKERV